MKDLTIVNDCVMIKQINLYKKNLRFLPQKIAHYLNFCDVDQYDQKKEENEEKHSKTF